MKKYLTVFSVSWSNGFVYRLNFLLWRFRSVIIILTIYFLWDAIFKNGGTILGYTRDRILTYVFLTLVLRSLILGQRSMDSAGEISDGRLSNYLLKPLNYHFYWLTRDLADKLLNLIFSILEISVLYLILRPPVFLQTDPLAWVYFLSATAGAILLNFFLGSIASYFSFWTPENSWGFWFVYLVFQDFMGGVMFPLDIFPKSIYQIVMLTPFPYLLYFPANLYLGRIPQNEIAIGLLVTMGWSVIGWFLLKKIWTAGIKSYQSVGR